MRQAYKWLAIKLAYHFDLTPLTGPMMGSIIVTYRCNSQCKMCDLWKRLALNKRGELDTEGYFKVIDDFARLGTTGVGFTGGEPLLREDIFELIEYVGNRGMIATISTNGLLLKDKKLAHRLMESCLHNINISLDSVDKFNQDWLRGIKGGFESTVEGIKNLVAYKREKKIKKPTITVVTVLSKRNIGELDNLFSFCDNLGADALGFIPVHNTVRDTSNNSWENLSFNDRDTETEIAIGKIIERSRNSRNIRIDNSERYIRLFPLAFNAMPSPVDCIAGYGSLFVDTYGNIYPCQHWFEKGMAVDNIYNRSLLDIWRSQRYEVIRKRLKSCRDCFWNCQTELSLMFGGPHK